MTKSPVVQDDLLVQIGDQDLRDLMFLLEWPFFGLSHIPSKKVHNFTSPDGKTYLRCSPGARGGPTQNDHDILIYFISMLHRMNEERRRQGLSKNQTLRLNNETGSYEIEASDDAVLALIEESETDKDGDAKLSFVAHDLLKLLRRQTGQRAYNQLKQALFRLRSASIETNIGPDTGRNRGFGWISRYEFVEETLADGSKRMKNIDVWITPWVIQALTAVNSVLQINPAYFELTSGIEKRLYQIARKHCGKQNSFSISLPKLAAKVGTSQEIRQFKAELLKVIKADNIPDYVLALVEPEPMPGRKRVPADRLIVSFTPRKGPWISRRVLSQAEREAERANGTDLDASAFIIEDQEDDEDR